MGIDYKNWMIGNLGGFAPVQPPGNRIPPANSYPARSARWIIATFPDACDYIASSSQFARRACKRLRLAPASGRSETFLKPRFQMHAIRDLGHMSESRSESELGGVKVQVHEGLGFSSGYMITL